MFARAQTGAIVGIEARPVIVEARECPGLPGTSLVGLARGAVRESLTRVRSAIAASGFRLSGSRRVANLLPAELPKDASSLDLALAVALLACDGHLPAERLAGRRFFGELSLGGTLEPVRGAVVMADLARSAGDNEVILPLANAEEAAIIPGVTVIGAGCLREVVGHLTGFEPLPAMTSVPEARRPRPAGCLSEVRGQRRAKRALEIAAAGGHNLLLIGPPGSGKTMLARRLPTIMPPLNDDERIEVTRIHSAAGILRGATGLADRRPFRAPHHSASEAALCGGGSIPRPGEVTLAHRGVLFLDELPEFSRRALESLREPLEEGNIHIARAAMVLTFPADLLLVAAMNPCPCGRFRGDVGAGRPSEAEEKAAGPPCLCAFEQVVRYRSRISGPLLDRIDLHVPVEPVPFRDYAAGPSDETSHRARARVEATRQLQAERWGDGRTNAMASARELRSVVHLGEEGMALIEEAIDLHGLSARAVVRVQRVARTIADLDGKEEVEAGHLREALGLRLIDRDPGSLSEAA